VAIGSPLGCFLSVRGQHLGREFALPACSSTIYNVFHSKDPVAYRLEPLLLESEGDLAREAQEAALAWPSHLHHAPGEGGCQGGHGAESAGPPPIPPPNYVPFAGAKMGKRLHVALRQALNESVKDISSMVNKAETTVYQTLSTAQGMASAVQGWLGSGVSGSSSMNNIIHTLSGEGGGLAGSPPRLGAASSFAPDVDDEARLVGQWGLNQGRRVDYVLQESELEAAQEYLAALKAHNCYFKHPDFAAFIADYVVSGAPVPE
jgi:hypothetical protein